MTQYNDNIIFPFPGTFGSVSMVEDSSGEPPPESPEFEDVALALESADKEERERFPPSHEFLTTFLIRPTGKKVLI